jgi:serine/threonine-protein kinase
MQSDNSAPTVRPGDVLAGKYRVERILGVGGTGVVVAALHLQLDERVALKFLLPDRVSSAEAVARFEQQARASARITSQHMARLVDVGRLANGAPYLVRAYLDGLDLDAWLKQRGVLSVEGAIDFVLQASEALAEAHALGIVHHDLKPAKLFCVKRYDGELCIKLLDFGISKLTSPRDPGHGMTTTGAVMGSLFYTSPEQMQSGQAADVRSNVWALGVILYELVVGQPPFTGDSVTELAIKVATTTAPPLRSARKDAPASLEAVVARCLQKDPDKRFQNIGELAAALSPLAPPRSPISIVRPRAGR